jgi:hypothetical protein
MRAAALEMDFGPWQVVCEPADGGRLRRLAYDGRDLLTGEPEAFRPPARDLGRYETRPVYGYDDCFPTVDPCSMPAATAAGSPAAFAGQPLEDHGGVCWQEMDVSAEADGLHCLCRPRELPGVVFRRRVRFEPDGIGWEFEIDNAAEAPLCCLHVMHGLLRIDELEGLVLPAFEELFDEMAGESVTPVPAPGALARSLRDLPDGQTRMLILRGVRAGRATVLLAGGLRIHVDFPREDFPSLGLWYNRGGWPDEPGLGRREFALEPLAGPLSCLAGSVAAGGGWSVPPGGSRRWRIDWTLEAGGA